MGIDIEFPQGRIPEDAAGWARSLRKAPVRPSAGSVTPNELSSSTTDLIDETANTAAASTVAEHVAQPDPHTQYSQHDEVLAAADVARNDAASALNAHVLAADPHSQYLTAAEGNAVYEVLSSKNAPSGYAGLNASSRTSKGVDTTDDLVIDLATKGLVLKDTQGSPHYWRITISNAGAIVITDLGTTKP
jgi:hypothetical protein